MGKYGIGMVVLVLLVAGVTWAVRSGHPAGDGPMSGPAAAMADGAGASSASGTMPAADPASALNPGERPLLVSAAVSYAGDPATLPGSAKVFVFVRKPGERMPLAVQQLSPRELPKTLTFRGEAATVEVVARLSKLGQVNRAPDDVEAVSPQVAMAHPPQTVTLNLTESGGSASLQSVWDQALRQAPAGSSAHP